MSVAVAESIEQQPAFFANVLNRTEQISKNIYEKSPMKSDLLVKNAQLIDQNLVNLVNSLDANLSKTLEVYNQRKQSLQNQLEAQKVVLQDKFNSSSVVKKSNQFQNQLIDTLQNQLDFFQKQIVPGSERQQASSENSENSENMSQLEQQQNLIQRYKQLLEDAANMRFEIYSSYYIVLQKTPAFKKFQELKIFQEIVFDIVNQKAVQPINTNFVQPQVVKALALRDQGLAFSKQQQELVLAQYNTQKQRALEQWDSKRQLIQVQFNNAVEFSKTVVPELQRRQGVLREAVVKIYGNYFTVEFCKEFYNQNKTQIQQQLVKLREIAVQKKEQVVNKSNQIIADSKSVYANALAEYKRQRQALYEKENPLVEEPQQQE